MRFPILSALALLCLPLLAQSVSKLGLEKSTDLESWQSVPVTPEMLDANGEIVIPNTGPQQFYRMKVRLLQPPSIDNPPPATTGIEEGESVTFTVDVEGEGLSYQWYFGQSGDTSNPIFGANSGIFNTGALDADTSYWVRVSNEAGSTDSETVTVTINRPPTITTQPASQTIYSGNTATLAIEASGTAPLTYQWYRGNLGVTTAPVGTNSATFTTPALTATTRYWVMVSNPLGFAVSSLSTITVVPPAPPVIASFSANPTAVQQGGSSTLSWSVSGATSVTIDNGVGAVSASASAQVTPTSTTTYRLTASNAYGSVNAEATVTVSTAPPDMALIPAGSFTMGDSLDGHLSAPPVTVNVSAFYMGKYEVTKALWDEVRTWAASNGYSDLAAGGGKASNHPVQSISWYDMVKWCNARSEKEGLTPVYYTNDAQTTLYKTGSVNVTNAQVKWTANGYRLPTEAEWEKAARGGLSGKRFPWGDTISHSQANYYSSSGYSYDTSSTRDFHPSYAIGDSPYTSPVGSFAANGYGLHDMAGNVWEWCWDWYGDYTNGVTDPRGASSGSYRVYRGGSWDYYAFYCRAAFRYYNDPGITDFLIGFRVARSSVP
jgi:formylglycine-generating enzyme